MKLRFIIWFLIFNSILFGQDYIEYQKIINRLDEDILSKNYYKGGEKNGKFSNRNVVMKSTVRDSFHSINKFII